VWVGFLGGQLEGGVGGKVRGQDVEGGRGWVGGGGGGWGVVRIGEGGWERGEWRG